MYAAAYLLETFGYGLEAEQQELEDFAASVAEVDAGLEEITRWFESHSRKARSAADESRGVYGAPAFV
jgi:hypothetical protein